MSKNALNLRLANAETLNGYVSFSDMAVHNIKLVKSSDQPAARAFESMPVERLIATYMGVSDHITMEDELVDELAHRSGFTGSEDDDEESEGKKEGSAKVEEMKKGTLPLEFLVKYLIMKNRPEKAFRLMVKAMEKAKTPAKMAEIMGVAYVAVEELKAMQYWDDIKQIQDCILIGSAPTGTCMHSSSALTVRMLDFGLMTSASIPRSYRVKEAGHYHIGSQGLGASFASQSQGSTWHSGLQTNSTSYSFGGSEIGERFSSDVTRSRSKSRFSSVFSKNGLILPTDINQISSFESVVKTDEFAYSQPNLVFLNMISNGQVRDGERKLLTGHFTPSAQEWKVTNNVEGSEKTVLVDNASEKATESYDLDAPKPADLEGFVRRIDQLIDEGMAVEALYMALFVREKFDIPEKFEAKIDSQIEESGHLALVKGLLGEDQLKNLTKISFFNLSAEYSDNLLKILDPESAASVIMTLKDMLNKPNNDLLSNERKIFELIPGLAA